jgi:predicted RND superfamily exporter protein
MAPTEMASFEPDGEIYEVRDEMAEKLPPSVHRIAFIVESRNGDILTQEALWELYQNEERLRSSDIGMEYLYTYYDAENDLIVSGIYTVADAVNEFLRMDPEFGVTLENANDDQVKLVLHKMFSDPAYKGLVGSLSMDTEHETRTVLGEEIEYWTSPAFIFGVNFNNSKISLDVGEGGVVTEEHEKLNRKVQDILRGDEENHQLWGIAIDVSLEALEQSSVSIPLIIGGLILIIIIVSFQFRSIKMALLTVLGLIMLIIWMKGLANLVGLYSSLTNDILLPIAILVLGVDYVIHAIHRYKEEKENGSGPERGFILGMAGVGGALTLAMLTTFVAFISNASSSIQETREFGIAAALGIVSAFIIMGFFVPLVYMKWDARSLRKKTTKKNSNVSSKGSILSKRIKFPLGKHLGRTVGIISSKNVITLIIVLAITLVSGYYALQLESKIEPADYLDPESDVVVSLDMWQDHFGDITGENAYVYIEGDLTDPEVLETMRAVAGNIKDNEYVARNPADNSAIIKVRILEYLEAVLESETTISMIEADNPGLIITDSDSDGIPDTSEQLRAVYDHIIVNGIQLDGSLMAYEPCLIREGLYIDPEGEEPDATVIIVPVVGFLDQEVIKESKKELDEDVRPLEGVNSISYFFVRGNSFEIDRSLDAINFTLTMSIAIAVALSFIIMLVAFRSIKYSIITIIPVILVAIWLYGFMYLTGFDLNVVTCTIAAISIGVGVDYSVHITSRYRAERKKISSRREAMEKTATHSGEALMGSAMSTFLGFLVLAFAPMPLFSSFGILTAIMILMAFVAALFVLPPLLMLADRKENAIHVERPFTWIRPRQVLRAVSLSFVIGLFGTAKKL